MLTTPPLEPALHAQCTLGTLIDTLRTAVFDAPVFYDFGCLMPTPVDSWRGSYREAALGWTMNGPSVTVSSLLNMLELAVGAAYQGWKGGSYIYGRHTALHVDNPGVCSNTEITWVEIGPYAVMLHTRHREER